MSPGSRVSRRWGLDRDAFGLAASHLGKYWVRPDIENRIREGSIAVRLETQVVEIHPTMVIVEGPQGREELPADAVFLLTGYHPDRELLARPSRAPPIPFDPFLDRAEDDITAP